MKTMANLDKEVEERRFYHNIHNTDTNVVITTTDKFFWQTDTTMLRAWMMDVRWFCEILNYI